MQDAAVKTDEKLMTEVRDGNVISYKLLVDRYQLPLLKFVYWYIKDYEETKDIVQETFLQLFRLRRNYKVKSKFNTYLYTIAKSYCYMRLRKKKMESLESYKNSEGRLVKETAINSEKVPEEILIENESNNAVKRAVDSLPGIYKEIIAMRMFQELSYKEITEILQVREGALRFRMHQALELLRKILVKN
jgi:RNA polymerase sigma-70 factor (ECF subfamily)